MNPYPSPDTAPRKPPTIWEESSVAWRHAKEHLEKCRADLEHAQTLLNEAVQQERQAWNTLEKTAGRGEAKPAMELAYQSPYALNGQQPAQVPYPR